MTGKEDIMHIYYYLLMLITSAILMLMLVRKWRKRFDVSFAVMFIIVFVSNLGSLLYFCSHNLDEVLAAQKIIYIGGCFLPMMFFFAVIRLCRLPAAKWMKTVMVSVSMLLYALVLTIGVYPLFYSSASFAIIDDVVTVTKTYDLSYRFQFRFTAVLCAGTLRARIHLSQKDRCFGKDTETPYGPVPGEYCGILVRQVFGLEVSDGRAFL